MVQVIQVGSCRIAWHDLVAGAVCLMMCAGLLLLEAVGRQPDGTFTTVLGASMAWLFRGAVDKVVASAGHEQI